MNSKTIRRAGLVVAAALAVTAGGVAPGLASASAAGPQHARTTEAVIPPAQAAAPAGLPSRAQQIKVLTAALANMHKNYKALNQLTGGTLGPQDVFDYGVDDLWKQGIDGAGTTIAVLEGWNLPDIAQRLAVFDKAYGLPAPPGITTIFPAGPQPAKCPAGMADLGDYGSCTAWQGELLGDVVSAHLIAPYAKIVISVTPAGSDDDAASQIAMPEMMKAMEVISSRHLANVISISNGTGEATYPNLADILADNPADLTAAASGVPVAVATGDCGVLQALPVANAPCSHVTAGPDTATWGIPSGTSPT